MANTIEVNIVSAEKEIYSGVAEMVFAPGIRGEMGIAPKHAPLLTFLRPGSVRVKSGADEDSFYVSGGMLEIQLDKVTVLSDTAVRARDLDEAKAKEAKEAAEKAMIENKSEYDYATAVAEFKRALAQLDAIKKLRKK